MGNFNTRLHIGGSCVPHQANLRIIESLANRGVPVEKLSINIHRYGNMSTATTAIAQVEELEECRVEAGSNILMPGFGRGLIWCAHLLKCEKRITHWSLRILNYRQIIFRTGIGTGNQRT